MIEPRGLELHGPKSWANQIDSLASSDEGEFSANATENFRFFLHIIARI
jgi:hypothetical protein